MLVSTILLPLITAHAIQGSSSLRLEEIRKEKTILYVNSFPRSTRDDNARNAYMPRAEESYFNAKIQEKYTADDNRSPTTSLSVKGLIYSH